MRKIIIAALGLLNACLSSAAEIHYNEISIGQLHIGNTPTDIKKHLPECTFNKAKKEKWESDGAYHQYWSSSACGVEIYLVSDTPRSAQAIESISVNAGSSLATEKGIKIGSSEADIRSAYKRFINKAESIPGKFIVVGEMYEGLRFEIENKKVKSFFMGGLPD